MENAGRNLAHLARLRFFDGDAQGRRVVVLAGSGGNGGGALVSARRLANYGAAVTVFTSRKAGDIRGVPAQQLNILRNMGLPVAEAELPEQYSGAPDLIIDGLIGYSLRGAPQGQTAELIRWANSSPAPVLALDAPSGVDTTSGTRYKPAIQATATMTLALPKAGLLDEAVQETVGELYLADISVPPALYSRPPLNLDVGPLFARSDLLRLR